MTFKLLNTALRAPEGTGTGDGGGTGGGQQTQQSGAPPAATTPPWGPDVNQTWMVGDKPWYETFLPDGPSKELFREKKYANPVVVADAYHSANRMLNGNAIEVPAADAKPEAWQAFHEKLGAFKDPSKYDVKIKDGVQADPKLVDFSKQLAAKHGLTPKQIQGIVDDWNETIPKWNTEAVQAQQTEAGKQNEAQVNQLKEQWGPAWEENTTKGKNVALALFDVNNANPAVAAAEKARMASIEKAIGGAAMLDLFARLGAKTGEGTFGGQGGGGGGNSDPANMDPQAAKAEINRLNMDEKFQEAYNNLHHPGHAEAVKRMEVLYSKAGSAAA